MIKFITNGGSLEVRSGDVVLLLAPMKNIAFTSLELYQDIPTISLYNIDVGSNELLFTAPLSQVADSDGNFFTTDSFLRYASLNFGMTSTNTATLKISTDIVINGMVNNLASQGSGGYDFMEWTSNVTTSGQIPLWRNPKDFKILEVTFVWMGVNNLQIGVGEQVKFEIGYITNNTSSQINNFNSIATLFTLDSTYNNTFASGQVAFSTPIDLAKYQNLAIVGTETGTVTPNDGELGISLLLKNT